MQLNRYSAFVFHLFGSLSLALASAAVVFWVWYPGPLAGGSGVTIVFLMMLGIDAILGPCVTLFVFNPQAKGVRELALDMLIIVVVQLSALLAGLYSMFEARPAYLVLTGADGFKVAYANDLLGQSLTPPLDSRFRRAPFFGPEWVAVNMPSDPKALDDVKFARTVGGPDALAQLPLAYVAYFAKQKDAARWAEPLELLKKLNPSDVGYINHLVDSYSAGRRRTGFLPLRAKAATLAVILDRQTGEIFEISSLRAQ
jgi:hypothetical protein